MQLGPDCNRNERDPCSDHDGTCCIERNITIMGETSSLSKTSCAASSFFPMDIKMDASIGEASALLSMDCIVYRSGALLMQVTLAGMLTVFL
mmetsp:Transcript_2048/g.1946  ORF Transcript_2048/g.1946 Transcript_2048/m.1946 type:complete len:92 (+) Transcript_2048:298-573(+)